MSAYRKLATVTPDVVFPRGPDYPNPPSPDYDERQCPKCGVRAWYGNQMSPKYCTGPWWRRWFARRCPAQEHLHQRCGVCKAKWTTGVLK